MLMFFSKDPPAAFLQKYRVEDSSSYDIETRRRDRKFSPKLVRQCLYRPLDSRWLYYDVGLTSRPAEKVMRHFLAGENLGLITTRQTKEDFGVLATLLIAGHKSCAAYDINTVFPLYLYPNGGGEMEAQGELVPHENGRRPNLAAEFVRECAEALGLGFVADGCGNLKKTFGPEDVFHYAYAVFHSSSYRKRYEEFLKLDFPRLPITSDAMLFRRLCERGRRLVDLHTLREQGLDAVDFDVPGDNVVEQVVYVPPKAASAGKGKSRVARQAQLAGGVTETVEGLAAGAAGRVYINHTQYFEGILPVVWGFRIGGYQVCEKWLKDRKGRKLEHDEIEHYQHTVTALAETRTLMAEIDSLIHDHGGWPLV